MRTWADAGLLGITSRRLGAPRPYDGLRCKDASARATRSNILGKGNQAPGTSSRYQAARNRQRTLELAELAIKWDPGEPARLRDYRWIKTCTAG